MLRHPGVLVLLIALVVGVPALFAITIEAWTDGIYDAESDYSAQATNSAGAAVACEPVLAVGPIRVVFAILPIVDEVPIAPTTLAASDTRAPPIA